MECGQFDGDVFIHSEVSFIEQLITDSFLYKKDEVIRFLNRCGYQLVKEIKGLTNALVENVLHTAPLNSSAHRSITIDYSVIGGENQMSSLDIEELKKGAREYVEIEANTSIITIEFESSFTFLGEEDVVFSVKTTNKQCPEWWVVCGSSLMNLYPKNKFNADEVFSFHTGMMLRLSGDGCPRFTK